MGGCGTNLILALGLVSDVFSEETISFILGVMTPGFTFCAATSSTLSVEVVAGSSCIPSFSIAFLSAEGKVIGDDGSSLVGDAVASELGDTGDAANSSPFS